jgi:hypothetical protein
MKRPPSREQWSVEGELRGHTPSEVIHYMSDCADFEDAVAQRRAIAVPSAGEAWWRLQGWLRRVMR